MVNPDSSIPAGASLESDLRRARILATLLDAQFQVLGFKFGLDPLIGLVPIIGDTLTLVAGLYPLLLVRKHGLGRSVAIRMGINLLLDYAGGLIPVAGDVFDAAYRANLKNLALLEAAARRAGAGN